MIIKKQNKKTAKKTNLILSQNTNIRIEDQLQ